MKVGIDANSNDVFLEVSTSNGLSTTVNMTPALARIVASQLIASADTLDHSYEQGLIEDDNVP